ncbi:hypothetical protein RND81_11G142000 [Saponaria officinalis]|uniref:J domain-containing protein n=1 Tax=Saponaria officinalis TaxID=3572 RepID=A0AAW1HNN4_SAPOF
MDHNTPRAEAERWLGISAKLLTARDFLGSKTFAIRARDSDPNNHLSDQILAVVDTVLAAEKRVNPSQHPDWYSVLQLPRLVRDPDLIAGHYRRLLVLLDPERNRLPFADYALRMVLDGWAVLSDPNKKWLFDNELSLYLQSVEHHFPPPPPPQQPPPQQQQQPLINTFQFFQPPSVTAQPTEVMWQHVEQHQQHHHQQHQQHQPHNDNSNNNNINNFNINSSGGGGSQLHQIEFMQAPPQQQPPEMPPQWRVRDVEGNKGGFDGVGLSVSSISPTPMMRRVADVAPVRSNVMPPPQPPPVVVAETTRVIDGGNTNSNANILNINNNDNNEIRVRVNAVDGNIAGVVNEINNNTSNNATNNDGIRVSVVDDSAVNENNDENVEEIEEGEEIESFWTSCPYCFYTYEYPKMYKECTLRCQNCRRGFHAVQVANPPLMTDSGVGKDKTSSFGSWGFFPVGFSSVTWKKNNRMGKSDVASNWVPFSPMFVSPVENGGESFKWFSSSGAASVGPKNTGRLPVSRPRVYIDEDNFDSEPSDSDSSDKDWRKNPVHKKKMKMKRRGNVGPVYQNKMRKKRRGGGGGRPRQVDLQNLSTQTIVVGLNAVGKDNAVVKDNAKKKVAATVTRNLVKRKVKNMGKLDLNVEFNNEGDEHAPTVSAVNGEDDAIENIGFFEGLDEFFSTLPILNVGGEKAKPS